MSTSASIASRTWSMRSASTCTVRARPAQPGPPHRLGDAEVAEVVVLDQDPLGQVAAVVHAATGAHRRLLEGAQARRRLAGVPDAGAAVRRPARSGACSVAMPERWPRKFSAVRSAVRMARERSGDDGQHLDRASRWRRRRTSTRRRCGRRPGGTSRRRTRCRRARPRRAPRCAPSPRGRPAAAPRSRRRAARGPRAAPAATASRTAVTGGSSSFGSSRVMTAPAATRNVGIGLRDGRRASGCRGSRSVRAAPCTSAAATSSRFRISAISGEVSPLSPDRRSDLVDRRHRLVERRLGAQHAGTRGHRPLQPVAQLLGAASSPPLAARDAGRRTSRCRPGMAASPGRAPRSSHRSARRRPCRGRSPRRPGTRTPGPRAASSMPVGWHRARRRTPPRPRPTAPAARWRRRGR